MQEHPFFFSVFRAENNNMISCLPCDLRLQCCSLTSRGKRFIVLRFNDQSIAGGNPACHILAFHLPMELKTRTQNVFLLSIITWAKISTKIKHSAARFQQ